MYVNKNMCLISCVLTRGVSIGAMSHAEEQGGWTLLTAHGRALAHSDTPLRTDTRSARSSTYSAHLPTGTEHPPLAETQDWVSTRPRQLPPPSMTPAAPTRRPCSPFHRGGQDARTPRGVPAGSRGATNRSAVSTSRLPHSRSSSASATSTLTARPARNSAALPLHGFPPGADPYRGARHCAATRSQQQRAVRA
jgi:hypothetical protein